MNATYSKSMWSTFFTCVSFPTTPSFFFLWFFHGLNFVMKWVFSQSIPFAVGVETPKQLQYKNWPFCTLQIMTEGSNKNNQSILTQNVIQKPPTLVQRRRQRKTLSPPHWNNTWADQSTCLMLNCKQDVC